MIIKDISIFFISIMVESIPFLLLGSIIAGILEEFISEDWIIKHIPKNKILASIFGIFLGIFIPACDCAVIPIAKKLKQKNIPTNVIVSFITASPVINPVVILASMYAFRFNLNYFILRTFLAIIISLILGVIVSKFAGENILNEEKFEQHHHHEKSKKGRIANIFSNILTEFMEILPFMVIGALIASIMQTIFSINIIHNISQNKYISTLILMVIAYLLSLCSTSDSFIAKTFVNITSNNSIIAFLLLGPMIDVKNTIVLMNSFNKKFVKTYILSTFIIIYIISVALPI